MCARVNVFKSFRKVKTSMIPYDNSDADKLKCDAEALVVDHEIVT